MNTAVAISLDYELHSTDHCEKAWKALYMLFLEAGFELQDRLLITPMPLRVATPLARAAIRQAGEELAELDIELHEIVRSCTVFEFSSMAPLRIPGSASSEFGLMSAAIEAARRAHSRH